MNTFLQRDQLSSHEEQVTKLENTLADHKRGSVPTKGLALQNYREKETYLQFEVRNLNEIFVFFPVNFSSSIPAETL